MLLNLRFTIYKFYNVICKNDSLRCCNKLLGNNLILQTKSILQYVVTTKSVRAVHMKIVC